MAPDPTAWPTIRPGTVSVVITVLKDPRVARTLESLLNQVRPPDEVLVDDGGGTDEVRRITQGFHARDPRIRHLDAPGNIPESRNTAILTATGEFIAFLDADELAPPGWLEALLGPFRDPQVGFAGGPTPALAGTTSNAGARYYDAYLRRFYEEVARVQPHALPMGNSAWRAQVFRDVGLLDSTLYRKAASEDQEVAVRALRHGYRGVYVPEASVDHDFSDITTWGLLRKQRIYAEGGFVVWRRRGTTYEASAGRVLPYVALPFLLLVGGLLVLPAATRAIGLWLLGLGAGGLGLLALILTVQGWSWEREYPGSRFRVLEIPRRWATLYGAFRGLLTYGWTGKRSPPVAAEPTVGKP